MFPLKTLLHYKYINKYVYSDGQILATFTRTGILNLKHTLSNFWVTSSNMYIVWLLWLCTKVALINITINWSPLYNIVAGVHSVEWNGGKCGALWNQVRALARVYLCVCALETIFKPAFRVRSDEHQPQAHATHAHASLWRKNRSIPFIWWVFSVCGMCARGTYGILCLKLCSSSSCSPERNHAGSHGWLEQRKSKTINTF